MLSADCGMHSQGDGEGERKGARGRVFFVLRREEGEGGGKGAELRHLGGVEYWEGEAHGERSVVVGFAWDWYLECVVMSSIWIGVLGPGRLAMVAWVGIRACAMHVQREVNKRSGRKPWKGDSRLRA